MKATGIVRKIDDLGRIVIPKEIRKTMRVKEGMALEIFTDEQGGIVLRKYLPFSESLNLAREYAECLAQQTGTAAVITDREKIIAAAGCPGGILEGEKISKNLERVLDDRDERLPAAVRNGAIPIMEGMKVENEQVFCLIRSGGEIQGAVILMARDEKKKMGELEQKVAAVAAEFLGRQATV